MNAASTCLRIVILLQCIGLGGRYFFSTFESESDVYGFLFFDHQWSEATAQRIDDWGALMCVVAGCCVVAFGLMGRLIKNGPQDDQASNGDSSAMTTAMTMVTIANGIQFLAAALVAAWFLILAALHSVRGEMYAELTLGEHAVRIAVPIALILHIRSSSCLKGHVSTEDQTSPNGQSKRHGPALFLLMFATAATFAAHGFKAFQCYGPFTDLILLSDARWTGFALNQSTAEVALLIIGIVDIIVAVLLVATRWRWIAIYMVVWGVITVLSRMTALGAAAWPETLIRAANWGAPFAVALLLTSHKGPRQAPEPSNEIK